jgi:ribonuclease H / adenosylcobalamin/alpha-ribazole phosphatase
VIEDEGGTRLRTFHRYIGIATNNVAEYHALIDGLTAIAQWKPDNLDVLLDSKLVVEQVNGKWKVKEPGLKELHRQAVDLLKPYGTRVNVRHVDRSQNKGADKLVNMALDEQVKKPKSTG